MNMKEPHGILVAAVSGISIRSSEDIVDAIAACLGEGDLLITEGDLGDEFFDLRSGLAGELFQKIMNYRLRLAIVLSNPETYGERFNELVYEHKSHGMIRFFQSEDEAKKWLLARS
jgi:uncharacterized protein DUF4180